MKLMLISAFNLIGVEVEVEAEIGKNWGQNNFWVKRSFVKKYVCRQKLKLQNFGSQKLGQNRELKMRTEELGEALEAKRNKLS